jgi:glycosyltransferase involved in cell wall biosynthesis
MNQTNQSKMHLLIFIYSMGDGGAERVTADLANCWAAKEWDITIVTQSPINSDLYKLHPAINRISLAMASESANVLSGLWQNIRRVMALRKVLQQIRPDIALAMMTTANVLLALAAWGLPTLRTIGAEHNHPPQQPLGYLWETLRRYTYGLFNAVTTLASEGENWLERNTNAKKIVVIPNAVNWPLLAQDPRIIPSASYQSERQLLLAAGRLHPQKGFDWLIDVFSNLAHNHPNWDLVILGEGSLRAMLERKVRESRLENRIFLPGRAGNINEWYETADLYVMSSRYEGFGNTLVEAMAYGLAVISFDCDTGPRDIIRHKVDGLLVPPGDIVALNAALDKMMSNDALRLRLAERAIDARERFSMAKITRLWEQLFDEVLIEQS